MGANQIFVRWEPKRQRGDAVFQRKFMRVPMVCITVQYCIRLKGMNKRLNGNNIYRKMFNPTNKGLNTKICLSNTESIGMIIPAQYFKTTKNSIDLFKKRKPVLADSGFTS